ncbi:MAG: nucleotidyltransferase [Planctomycetes bacterium]|nr:nucleotidyltransferase [Planctomycetota bacterium]
MPTLVIMAAGIGSRYGGLKQIDPIGPGGEIVIDYSIYDAIQAGFSRIVFIIRRDTEQAFREKIGRSVENRVDTAYVFQDMDFLPKGFAVPAGRTKPWGTAHAVLCSRDAVKENFGVINADDFYGRTSFKLLCDFLKQGGQSRPVMEYCLIGYIINNTLSEHGHVARGVCQAGPDGLLRTIDERTKIVRRDGKIQYTEDDKTWVTVSPETLVSMNMWGFTPGVLAEIEARFPVFLKANINNPKAEFFLPTVAGQLVDEKKAAVKVIPTPEKWYGITYKEDKPIVQNAVRAMVERGLYPARLWR